MNSTVIAIESNSKAAKTKARYNCTNYLFILWVYDNRATYPDSIRPAFLPGLDEARSRDRQARTSKNTYFRQTVIKLLDDTNPSANNCPLDMKNVTYTIVATYLSSIKTTDGLFKG